METIEEIFSDILKFMRISEEQIRPEASFVTDFHFKDVDFICLILYINIYFRIMWSWKPSVVQLILLKENLMSINSPGYNLMIQKIFRRSILNVFLFSLFLTYPRERIQRTA